MGFLSRSQPVLVVTFFTCANILAAASPAPKLTSSEAIRIANDAARKKGIELGEFRPPHAYHKMDGSDLWWVSYKGRLQAPGLFFTVTVHDKTRTAEVHPGA